MEEYHQITLDEWTSWKEDIRNKLAETAQNFVYIGYRLKQIRDSGMFGGAADVFEFAQNEYGLGKSTVSRFIAINEKYSKEGNSLELKDEYKGFSSSKLSEMLTLPDSECELITEKTTIKDIRELKNFDKQDPVEASAQAAGYSPLELCIIDYFKDKREMLNELIINHYNVLVHEEKEAAECMNPAGCGTHSKGICFLFMYEYEKGIKYKLLMQQEPVSMSWNDFLSIVWKVYSDVYFEGAEDIHKAFYKTEDEKPKETPVTMTSDEKESQEPQQPEPIAENENAVSEPPAEEEKTEEPVNNIVEANSEKSENEEAPINTEEEEPQKAESQETTCAKSVATSQQEKDDGEHSDDRFIRRGQMQERLEKLQKAINLQEWEYALDLNKHLGWDIEWMLNN